jgi:hypothetical protein
MRALCSGLLPALFGPPAVLGLPWAGRSDAPDGRERGESA